MKNKTIKHIFFVLLLSFAVSIGKAQTVRNIVVSYDKSFTDHVSLASDSRDMDLMIKFIFNEDKNQLTVSLISYRYLFVFRENARYKNIIRRNRLYPDNLPYVTDFPDKSRFFLSSQFRKSIPKPHKEYMFTRWIDYNGLQPVPMEYKMINDYIEQKFDITNYGNNVTVRLGDVYVMDKTPKRKHPDDYTIVAGKNLNIEYSITIIRNPCFGMENEIQLAENTMTAVQKAYRNLKTSYKSRKVESEAALKTFNNLKYILLSQFPKKNSDSSCPDLKEAWDSYDTYVDSISAMNCTLVLAEDTGGTNPDFDPTDIYSLARQIDRNISRWLISKDNVERQDLVKECEDIIEEVNRMIGRSGGSTPEQKKAVNIFRDAEAYFKETCVRKK